MKSISLFNLLKIIIRLNIILIDSYATAALTFPAGCSFTSEEACSLKSQNQAEVLENNYLKIKIESGAIISKINSKHYYLGNGYYHILAKETLTIETRFGEVLLEPNGELIIEVSSEKLFLGAISELVKYRITKTQDLLLPRGYGNYLGLPGVTGEVLAGIPSVVPLKLIVEKLNRNLNYTKNEIENILSPLKDIVPLIIEERSQRYLASVKEEIEKDKKNKEFRALSLERKRIEEKKIKEEFFRKTFLE